MTAETGESVERFFPSSTDFNAKVAKLEATEVDMSLISLYIESPRGRTMVFGKISVLMAPTGSAKMSYDDIVKNPEAKTYDLRTVPSRLNVCLPPVKPWEKHMTAVTTATWAAHVGIKVIGRVNSAIDASDVFLQVKAEYEFRGTFKPPHV